MTQEKLFEFANERGWHKILEAAYTIHSLNELATLFNKKERSLLIELRVMESLGLLSLSGKPNGLLAYVPTVLGIKFLQEQNMKKGRTFTCHICGTTTGVPHLCPEFYPEMKQ